MSGRRALDGLRETTTAAFPRRGPPRKTLFVLSIGLHAILFLLAFASASGDLVSGGGDSGGPTGPVFAVTLVRAPSPSSNPQSDAQALEALYTKMKVVSSPDGTPVPVGARSSKFSAMAERLQSHTPQTDAQPNPTTREAQGSPAPAPRPSSRSTNALATKGERDGLTAGAESSGEFWGRIEPCWRGLATSAKVAVKIEVALDGAGRLRAPPTILREDSAQVDDLRLRSEERALNALAACMSRTSPRFGGRVYQLTFAPVRN